MPTDCLIGVIDVERGVRFTRLTINSPVHDSKIPRILDELFPATADIETVLDEQTGAFRGSNSGAHRSPQTA